MKNLALAVCCMFILSSLSFAGMHRYKDMETKEEKETRKAKFGVMKNDFMEYQKNLEALIEKYNTTDGKSKANVKKEIRVLVATQTDKDIVLKKEMLEDQKARISKLEEFILDLETNKDKRIDEKVDFFTSTEGQIQMKEMRDRKSKMGYDDRFDRNSEKHKKDLYR